MLCLRNLGYCCGQKTKPLSRLLGHVTPSLEQLRGRGLFMGEMIDTRLGWVPHPHPDYLTIAPWRHESREGGFCDMLGMGSWGELPQRLWVDISLPNTNELPLPHP